MKTELIASAHAVGESNYHIQLTPAYRREIFSDPLVAELTLAYMAEKLKENKVVLVGYGYGPDHMHLFVSNVRFISEIKLLSSLLESSYFVSIFLFALLPPHTENNFQ